MNRYLQSALVAALGVASMTCAYAQDTAAPPSSSQPDPTTTTQAPPTTTPDQSSTTPHSHRQAAAGSKASEKQMLKDCVAQEQANNPDVSASQAKKTCKAQLKSHSSEPKNY